MDAVVTLPRYGRNRTRQVERIAAFLLGLDDAKAWRVTVAEHKPRRSESQNRYLWGVCYPAFLAVLPGWDAEDIHEYLLGEWAGWEVLEGMGRKRMKPIRRSSRLNKQEFSDYIAFIQRKGAEHGVFVPDPEGDL